MTANDSDVSDGETLTGSQVVRVYGNNLTAPFVTMTFKGVEYTPLYQGEGYIDFIMNDNGTATINVDGSRFMSFEIEGAVVPAGLPAYFFMRQFGDNVAVFVNEVKGNFTCLNYPYLYDVDYPNFLVAITGQNPDWAEVNFNDFEVHNFTIERNSSPTQHQIRVKCNVTDISDVAYLTYQGFIIAVLNYTTD